MNTYGVWQFDPHKPSLYTGRVDDVKAGNIRSARTEAARNVRGKVSGPVVIGPDGMAYDVMLERKWA